MGQGGGAPAPHLYGRFRDVDKFYLYCIVTGDMGKIMISCVEKKNSDRFGGQPAGNWQQYQESNTQVFIDDDNNGDDN